jgi:hypothetical protein
MTNPSDIPIPNLKHEKSKKTMLTAFSPLLYVMYCTTVLYNKCQKQESVIKGTNTSEPDEQEPKQS